MAKPSIFSRNYEQRMKRRKINITLFVLILISAGYFGVRYYLDINNININFISKMSKGKKAEEKKEEEKKVTPPAVNKPEETPTDTPVEVKTSFYEYKSPSGQIYKIEYTETSSLKEIVGIKSEAAVPSYDISTDKKSIVFDDLSSGDIIIMDSTGAAKKINYDTYNSKSSGILIKKDEVLKRHPNYIWAAKPHFTSDGGVVFITNLPYIKNIDSLYLWCIRKNGSMKMAGKLIGDINKISYEDITASGALKINVNNTIYYFIPGENELSLNEI